MGTQKLRKKRRKPEIYPVPNNGEMERGITEEELNSYLDADSFIEDMGLDDWGSEVTDIFDEYYYYPDRKASAGDLDS